MDNIKNSEDFYNTYSSLLENHNYRGLVDLLSKSTFNNEEARQNAKRLQEKFQEQADINDKMLEGIGEHDPQRYAYNFITTGPSKSRISDETSPDYKFMTCWNALSDDKGSISISLKNEAIYNKFMNILGVKNDDTKEFGITKGKDYTISFNTDVNNKIQIYNALDKSGIIDYFTYKFDSESSGNNPDANNDLRSTLSDTDIKIGINLEAMRSVVQNANKLYSNLVKQRPYLQETITTGYMGEDDKRLQDAFSKGLMNIQTFKELRSLLEEKYDRVLSTMSLSQYDVWSMNEDNNGSQVLEELNDNIVKSQLNNEINQAIADKRLHFAHASNGLDVGTMITIDPKLDSDGKPIEGYDKPRRLFVKDLFKSEAETALRNNTEMVAQMQYAKHQTYGHIYRGSNFTLTDWDGNSNSATYTDSNGVEKRLGRADILDILDEDIITKRMIEFYNDANKTDSNGNGYTKEYYDVYGNNKINSKDLYNNIITKCLIAVKQKYNNQSDEFIKYKTQDMVSNIMKNLNIDFSSEINNSDNTLNKMLNIK